MKKCKNCGNPLILNKGKCIYCGTVYTQEPQPNNEGQIRTKSKQIVQRRSLINQPKSIQDLKIKVTSPHFDNIGVVLDQLGVKYEAFDENYYCDILFINCGTSDFIDYSQLKVFVENGGILYVSDLASSHIIATWPNLMIVDNATTSCTKQAKVVDPDLMQHIGKDIDVNFDLGGWSKISEMSNGKVLMECANEFFPIMVEFTIGKGKIFYTSFHNHAQTAEAENKLLKLLVIKQVATATKQDFNKTIASMSVSL